METSLIETLIESLSWPITLAVILVLYRSQLRERLSKVKEFKGLGIEAKFQELESKVHSIDNRADVLEQKMNLYNLTAEEKRVRKVAWSAVASVLEKVSKEAQAEIKLELSRYHLANLNIDPNILLQELSRKGFLDLNQVGDGRDPGVLTPEVIAAVKKFQMNSEKLETDGIVGPDTLRALGFELN